MFVLRQASVTPERAGLRAGLLLPARAPLLSRRSERVRGPYIVLSQASPTHVSWAAGDRAGTGAGAGCKSRGLHETEEGRRGEVGFGSTLHTWTEGKPEVDAAPEAAATGVVGAARNDSSRSLSSIAVPAGSPSSSTCLRKVRG